MKDNFSRQASEYSKFRPQYPQEMIDYILSFVPGRQTALDAGTGNGQVAKVLSGHFATVYATDISPDQLLHAPQILNIIYRDMPAERTDFTNNLFDLITVAQAVHWFDFDLFYGEVRRTLKTDGILAVMGYGMLKTNPESDQIIDRFYNEIVGPFWDPEREYLEQRYQTIPFPFEELPAKEFTHTASWSIEQLLGYLETWSATEKYKAHHNDNPVDLIRDELTASWKKHDGKVAFPMLLRIGKP